MADCLRCKMLRETNEGYNGGRWLCTEDGDLFTAGDLDYMKGVECAVEEPRKGDEV